MTRSAVLLIAPTAPALANVVPSTMSWMPDAVRTQVTVCHAPLFRAGPAISSFEPAEPMNPQEAWPVGCYSTLNSPPALSKRPLRIRSQSGVAGALVVLRWIVIVSVADPGFSAAADGTERNPRVKPNAVPENPGTPTATLFRVPSCPPTASCITVPEVSSMCHWATSPVGGGGVGTTAVGADEATVALPTGSRAVTAMRSVWPA